MLIKTAFGKTTQKLSENNSNTLIAEINLPYSKK
jgi:hypothetical protein